MESLVEWLVVLSGVRGREELKSPHPSPPLSRGGDKPLNCLA